MSAPLVGAGCGEEVAREDDGGETGRPTSSGGTAGEGGAEGSADNGDGPARLDVNPGDDDATAGSMSDVERTCGEQNFDLAAVPPNIVLVLDRSRSMVSEQWDHDLDPGSPVITRWQSLHSVTSFLVNSFDDAINFGMVMFPGPDAEDHADERACIVSDEPDVAVGTQRGAAILQKIPAAGSDDSAVFGATPASKGIQTAREHLVKLDPTIDRAIILITDGAPNCGEGMMNLELFNQYDQNVEAEVASALADGIPTYVVGIDIIDSVGMGGGGSPAINTFEALNVVAQSGGVERPGPEKFYNAGNEEELRGALSDIAGQVVNCTLDFDEAPEAPMFVSVNVGGDDYEQIDDCSTEDGWQYTNEDNTQIQLCGAACDALGQQGRLDVVFGCPPAG